jgi:thiol-disulfide isomerase/thioredoxin
MAFRSTRPAPDSEGARLSSRRDILLLALAGTAASFAQCAQATPQERDVPVFESGKYQFTIIRPQLELPPIRLFRLEGGTIELTALRGKPILLNFWASWCAACKTELPILENWYRNVWRDSLNVAAVSEDRGDRATVARFVKELDLRTLPIFLDPNGYVAYSDGGNSKNAPFALYGMPITYLISSSGWIVGYMPGAADWSTPEADDMIRYLHGN